VQSLISEDQIKLKKLFVEKKIFNFEKIMFNAKEIILKRATDLRNELYYLEKDLNFNND
jgi:hypothetical protein